MKHDRPKRKNGFVTKLLLSGMVLVGLAFLADLLLNIDFATGLLKAGPVWVRYIVLLLAVGLCFTGWKEIAPSAVGVMRVPHPTLGIICFGCAIVAGLYAVALLVQYGNQIAVFTHSVSAQKLPIGAFPLGSFFGIMQGLFLCTYAVWMIRLGRQLRSRRRVCPTKSTLPGALALVPFVMDAMYGVLVHPSSLHRLVPFVQVMGALSALLWICVLLHSLYIALLRPWVKWLYLFGLTSFLLCFCFGAGRLAYLVASQDMSFALVLQVLHYCMLGMLAGGTSLAVARVDVAIEKQAL